MIFQKHAQPNGALLKLGCNSSMLWNEDLSLVLF